MAALISFNKKAVSFCSWKRGRYVGILATAVIGLVFDIGNSWCHSVRCDREYGSVQREWELFRWRCRCELVTVRIGCGRGLDFLSWVVFWLKVLPPASVGSVQSSLVVPFLTHYEGEYLEPCSITLSFVSLRSFICRFNRLELACKSN